MTADGPAAAQAMCPSCGTWNPWPPTGECSTCRAPLAGPLVGSIWDIDRQANDLQQRRRALVSQLRAEMAEAAPAPSAPAPVSQLPPPTTPPSTPTAHTAPATGLPPPPPRAATGITGPRAQTVLGLAGVGLLALAAIAFAAVTWRTLGPGVRVLILAAATVGASVIAVSLTARGLRSTGGALAGLATLLSFVTLLSAERLELLGDLGALSGATLGSVAAAVTSWVLSGRWRLESGPGVRIRGMETTAQVAWGFAVTFGVGWALDRVTNAGDWLPPIAIVAAALVWLAVPVLGRSIVGDLFASLWVLVASVAAPIVIAEGDGEAVAAVAAVAAGAVAAATWFGLARNRELMPLGWFLTVSTTSGLLVGVVLRLVPDDHPQLTYAAVLAAFLMLVVVQAAGGRSPIPAGWSQRGPAIGGLWPAVLPAMSWALVDLGAAVTGLLVQAARPWRPTELVGDVAPGGRHDAVVVLGAVAVLMIILVTIWEQHTRRLTTVSLLLLAVAAPAALWHVEARSEVVWLAAMLPTAGVAVLAAGLRDWLPNTPDRAVLVPIAAISGFVSIGWIAGTRPGTLVGGAVAFVLAGALRFGPGGLRRGAAGVATDVLLVTIGSWSVAVVGASASDLLALDPIVIGIVASLGATLGAWALQPRIDVDAAWVIVVGLAQLVTVGVALAAEEPLAASSAGFAAALAMFVLGMRAADVTTAPATWAAMVHATLANGILLADRGVEVVEAYTAVPAALLLALGTVRLARDPAARSVPTLLPGLLVFLVPTVLVLMGDVSHTGRALWLAGGSTALLVAGVRMRLSAPVIAGAIGAGGVVLTQFPVVASVVPRWLVFAVLGLALVVISATYEARLRDVRRIRDQVQSYR